MFEDRLHSFVFPSFGVPRPLMPGASVELGEQGHQSLPHAVTVAEIYQAAWQKAIVDREIDKLFNPDYFDYQI